MSDGYQMGIQWVSDVLMSHPEWVLVSLLQTYPSTSCSHPNGLGKEAQALNGCGRIKPSDSASRGTPIDDLITPPDSASRGTPIDYLIKPSDSASRGTPIDDLITPSDSASRGTPIDYLIKPSDSASRGTPIDDLHPTPQA